MKTVTQRDAGRCLRSACLFVRRSDAALAIEKRLCILLYAKWQTLVSFVAQKPRNVRAVPLPRAPARSNRAPFDTLECVRACRTFHFPVAPANLLQADGSTVCVRPQFGQPKRGEPVAGALRFIQSDIRGEKCMQFGRSSGSSGRHRSLYAILQNQICSAIQKSLTDVSQSTMHSQHSSQSSLLTNEVSCGQQTLRFVSLLTECHTKMYTKYFF